MNVGRPGALSPDARASGSPRRSLAEAAERYLPGWAGRLTPHVLRHYCASQLHRGGMSLLAIQELLGHSWTGITARYVKPRELHQTGEKPQVSRSWQGRNSVPAPPDGCSVTRHVSRVLPSDAGSVRWRVEALGASRIALQPDLPRDARFRASMNILRDPGPQDGPGEAGSGRAG
jgi:hypothetical protein